MIAMRMYLPSDGPLTQGFGVSQIQGGEHAGTDFAYTAGGKIFDKVYAASAGKVIYAGDSRNMGWPNLLYVNIDFDRTDNVDHSGGNYIIIGHYDPQGNLLAYTGYGHLEEIYVSVGQWVNGRDHIAKVGATGFNFGKHLHFDFVINPYSVSQPPFYGRVDPTPYFIEYEGEDELTVAQIDAILTAITASENRIKAHVNALLLTGYDWGGVKNNPGLILHVLEVLKQIKALPTNIWWGVTVDRNGKKVPVIQDMANGTTEEFEQSDMLNELLASVSPEALAAAMGEDVAQKFLEAFAARLTLNAHVDAAAQIDALPILDSDQASA